MDKAIYLSLNSVRDRDIVLLEEERDKKRLNTKPQEIDEACFSLEDSDQYDERTPNDDSLLSGIEAFRMNSQSSPEVETIYQRKTVSESEENDLKPRGVPEATFSGRFLAEPSEESREIDGSRHSSIIPDFDRLLSDNVDHEANSEVLKLRCQELIQAGHKSEKIYDELRSLGFHLQSHESSVEGSVDLTLDGLDEDTSWSDDDCQRVVEMMRIGALCGDLHCDVTNCKVGLKMIADIEVDLENWSVVLPLVTRRLLDTIIAHNSFCDDSSCSVPYCSFFTQYRDLPTEEQRAALQSHYRKRQFVADFEEINIDVSVSSEFIQLESEILWPCVQHDRLQREDATYATDAGIHLIPRNGIDFLVNGHFGKCGQIGFTAMSTTLPPVLLNIVQFVSAENSSKFWNSMKTIAHENIVRHLWSCVDGTNVTVCRDHFCTDTESLDSLINKVKPRKLDVATGLSYVEGLVSAVEYLNSRKIYYLKWTASGIQMNYNYTSAQLCDFSLAVNRSTLEDDEEIIDVIADSLPPNILPPEIFSDAESEGVLGSFTEVWGIGCILYHIGCGHPVHYDLRHEPLECVRTKVKMFAPEGHLRSFVSGNVKTILSKIFTAEHKRISVQQLAVLL